MNLQATSTTSSLLKKFNWGWGITLFYLSFVGFMLFMVWSATQQKVEMVSTDYYKKELAYQSQIDKEKRTGALNGKMKWQWKDGNMELQFPVEMSTGSISADILFYRPSDSRMDISRKAIAGTDGKCVLGDLPLHKGWYLMQINWSTDGKDYYNEEKIQIP